MNEEDLRRYIAFTKSLLGQLHGNPEYSWFFESFNYEIVNSFFQNGNTPFVMDKFQNITESDVNRIKAYLNFIDRKASSYGKVFYSSIADDNLKRELIKDFKEMKIALKNDSFIEFGRMLSLQIENIFNYSLRQLDVHTLISNDLNYYQAVNPDWWNGNPFNFHQSFFRYNNRTNQHEPVELSYVAFKTKSIFLSIHFNYRIAVNALNDIYFLRNKGSHRDELTPEERSKLDQILTDFDKNYSLYHKLLFDIVNGIGNL